MKKESHFLSLQFSGMRTVHAHNDQWRVGHASGQVTRPDWQVTFYVTYITIVLVSIKSPSSQLTGAFRLYLSQGATAVVHGCSIRALDPNAE